MTQEEYDAKRTARYLRLLEAAKKMEAESDALLTSAHVTASMIPLGQPILVGHHSERAHRNAINRIDGKYRKGYELHKAAEEMRSRAASMQNSGVQTEDPDAVKKLQAEVDEAEKKLARMKATNKFIATKNAGHLTAVGLTPDEAIDLLLKTLYASDGAYPAYAISNLSANIRRIKKRVESVKAKQAIPQKTETIGRIVIEQNPSEMRTQITFAGKPSAKTIALLKSEGFKWSPSQGKWQRLIGIHAWNLAVEIANKANAE